MRLRTNIGPDGRFPKGVKAGNRDGYAWPVGEVNLYMADQWHETVIGLHDQKGQSVDEGTMAHTEEKLAAATQEVKAAFEAFQQVRDKLRTELKNDTASIAANCDKITAHMNKVRDSVRSVESELTSAEMNAAIGNAERLAAALTAIASVHASQLTFAVIGKTP